MTNTPNPQANTLDDAVGNLLNIYDQYLDESTIYLGADLTGSKLYKNALKKFQALITEARIDEVEKYDNHCAREMAMLQGEEKANGSLAVLKEQGYGSPYAKDRLKTLKENK